MRKKIFTIIASSIFCYSQIAYGQIYIFVSFAMPDKALQEYAISAKQQQAILVVNGLINDLILDTQKKCNELKLEVDVNPVAFQQYQVLTVPTIISDDGKQVKKLSGHISVDDALQIFAKD